MALQDIFEQIRSELPWVERTRLVVGPMASRELVKDAVIAAVKAPAVPSWCVGTFAELAAEIMNERKIPYREALSSEDRVDALSTIARQPFFAEAAPELATHLRDRAVAAKLARFVTGLDRFYSNANDLAAIAEYYRGRNPQPGLLVDLVTRLWERGELRPWSEGDLLRAACSALEEKGHAGKKIFIWGFAEFTPLEERFLEQLARGSEVRLIVPEGIAARFEEGARASGLRVNAATEKLPDERVAFWSPHTPWDELGFLHEKLSALRAQGVRWDEIAVFVPQDAVYKRLARKRLLEWNVPIHDPTLPDAWMDRPDWVWWRDFLRAAAGGFMVDDVRALASGSSAGETFARAAFATGASGGAAAMKRILSFAGLRPDTLAGQRSDQREDIPVLRALLESVAVFSRAMSPRAFYGALSGFAPRLKELTGRDPAVLSDFAAHLVSEREYLETFCARLSRFVPLFEEYLVRRSRAESPRHAGGLRFVAHGVLLPNSARHAIVLGANAISRARPSYDPWEWEGVEVRGVWERLHFGMPRLERMLRDEAFVEHALLAHENVAVSSVAYGLDGKPWSNGPLHARLREKEGRTPERAGGHPAVGWVTAPVATAKPEPVLRADLMARAKEEGGLGSLENPELSVSKFEDYLKCPFLFYGRHVLKIEREDEPGLAPSALARGKILHSVLERFLAAEIKGGAFASDRTQAAALAEAHVDAVVEKLLKDPRNAGTIPGLYAHGALVENTRHELLARVLGWHAWEAEYRAKHPTMRPLAVEQPLEVAVPVDRGVLTLKGKADRIDTDGAHAVVIDYKSGGQPFGGKELLAGTGVQLLAYLRAVELNKGLKPGGAFYLLVGRKVDGKNGVFLKSLNQSLYTVHVRTGGLTDQPFDAIFDGVFAVWREAATALLAGNFDPRPRRPKKDCPKCPFYGMCGYDYKMEDA